MVVAVVDATHFEHPEHTRLTLELWLLGGEKEAEREQYRGGLSRHEGKGSRREVVCKECLTRASDALIMLGASTLGASGGGRPSEEKYKFCILDDVGGSKKKSKKTRN